MPRLLTTYHTDGLWWARLGKYGPGIKVKDVWRHPLLFSEREGYARGVRVGPWLVRYLPPEDRTAETQAAIDEFRRGLVSADEARRRLSEGEGSNG